MTPTKQRHNEGTSREGRTMKQTKCRDRATAGEALVSVDPTDRRREQEARPMMVYTEDLQAAIDSLTLFWATHPLSRSRPSRPLVLEWAKEMLKIPSPFFKSDEERSRWTTTGFNRSRYQTEHMGERLLDVLRVAVELDRLLDVRLLLEAARWYEVEAIGIDEDLQPHVWAQIGWAIGANGYHLDFNPHVDRQAASRHIQEGLVESGHPTSTIGFSSTSWPILAESILRDQRGPCSP